MLHFEDSKKRTMTKAVSTLSPDWASPPGATILDLQEERGWKQTELAKRSGYAAI